MHVCPFNIQSSYTLSLFCLRVCACNLKEHSYIIVTVVILKLNKNTLGVKKVRGQSEAALQIGMYDQKR